MVCRKKDLSERVGAQPQTHSDSAGYPEMDHWEMGRSQDTRDAGLKGGPSLAVSATQNSWPLPLQ